MNTLTDTTNIFEIDPEVVRVPLCQWYPEFPGAALHGALFGAMVRSATPVVREYHSDLFHDAQRLPELLTGQGGFWWAVRHSGTNTGDMALAQWEISPRGAVRLYWVEVSNNDGAWSATFNRVPDDHTGELCPERLIDGSCIHSDHTP